MPWGALVVGGLAGPARWSSWWAASWCWSLPTSRWLAL